MHKRSLLFRTSHVLFRDNVSCAVDKFAQYLVLIFCTLHLDASRMQSWFTGFREITFRGANGRSNRQMEETKMLACNRTRT